MKKIILITILLSVFSIVKAQVFYKNDLIEIKGYLNLLDSSLSVQIKNISDSTLILNGCEPKYFKIKDNFVTELSLMSTGVSLLQPGLGDIMYFKRLPPKSNYTITIEKNEDRLLDINQFNLLFGIQYLVVSNDYFISDKIINKKLVEMVKEKKMKLYEYNLNLKISDTVNYDCIKLIKQ
jgi:hypothetical protein